MHLRTALDLCCCVVLMLLCVPRLPAAAMFVCRALRSMLRVHVPTQCGAAPYNEALLEPWCGNTKNEHAHNRRDRAGVGMRLSSRLARPRTRVSP